MVAKEGRSVYLEDLNTNPIAQESEIVAGLGIRSIAGTPLRYENRTIGTITVGCTDAGVISHDDRTLIGYMANLITTAIIKAQLYGAERETRIKLSALENISEAGLTMLSVDELLDEIATRIVQDTNMDWSKIILLGRKNGKLTVEHSPNSYLPLKDRDLNKVYKLIDDVLTEEKARVLKRNDISQVKAYLGSAGIRSIAMVPVNLRQNMACIVAAGKKSADSFSKKELNLIETLSYRSALAIENALLFSRLEGSYLETVESLVKAIEAKDEYTSGHSEHVAALARETSIALGMTKEEAERIYMAGLLHDVGKIGIPSSILYKTTKLSDDDYKQIKLHPTKGYEILEPISGLEDIAMIVLQHHERYDGTGYPSGLCGNDILLEARILAVADAYQAMISDRPYRKRLPVKEAKLEIRRGIGTQFDPDVARVFLSVLEMQSKLHKCERTRSKAGQKKVALSY
ncbi:MAG: HD domain-containing protein [Firmicutes bacterium]|nr:HD domain-containing protein [Bacillota bacterium]